ncbi:MAG: hypothetical protein WC471_05165 [Candidatus Woesearchaeota archaeon]
MENWIINKILEIVSLIEYNPEKRNDIEKALKRFLINPSPNFLLENEIKERFYKKDYESKERDLNNIFQLEEVFEMQDYVLTVDSNLEDLFFYVTEKYSDYNSKLKQEMGISIFEIIKFCTLIQNIYYCDLEIGGHKFNKNIFDSKKEAYYPYNLEFPDLENKKIIETASFISKDAIVYLLKVKNPEEQSIIKNINQFFDLLSFTIEDILKDNKIRFQDKPLLKIDEESYILINDIHLIWGLPSRLDSLLNNYSWYRDTKGKDFEKVTNRVLDEINRNVKIGGKFFPNIRYGEANIYEMDGLINFKDSSWFVECKGRIPRSDSFKGDLNSIKEDIKCGITNAENQALRAIRESETNQKIGDYIVKEKKGIMIIVEGMYPNLNQNPIIQFERINNNYPRYIISLLTLMEIIRQYDIYYLEKFLEWRSDPAMPIYCMSELDYWDYFTQMQNGLDKKKGYDTAKEKNLKIIFNGKRFNAPKIIKED